MSRTFTAQSLIGGIIQLLLFPLILSLAAGTFAWPAEWIFVALFYGFVLIVISLLLKRNPALLEERMSVFKSGSERDRPFLVFSIIAILWLIIMPLDVERFHWSQFPLWLQGLGILALLGAFFCMYLAFRENAYLTPTVRIQGERGHTVVSSGPYRYVRHPMYSGFHLFFIGLPLLLGSLVGLLLAPLLIGLFVRRAILEERLLQKNLPGYDLYMARVTSRFIPRLW